MTDAATPDHDAAPGARSRHRATRRLGFVGALVAAAAIGGGCRESLDGGKTCPALCPAQNVAIRDTVITGALLFDSTFVGYPARGTEQEMLLATRGDTLEVRGVIRFDTLTTFFVPANDTPHTITRVDSARLRLVLDTAKARLPDSVRFDLYDVDDTTHADTNSAAVLALFTPARRIGGITVGKAALVDTFYVPLSDSALLDKLTTKRHLRVGIRVDGTGPVSLRVQTVETSSGGMVSYRGSPDTAIKTILIGPNSSTPTDFPEIQTALEDYQLVAKYNLPGTPNAMAVGGVPGRRAYLRFNLPKSITDSTTVIRATLGLNQIPLPFGDRRDTMTIHAQIVFAGQAVTDLRRASDIISAPGLLVLDSMLVVPNGSGMQTIEMYGLVRAWGLQSTLTSPPPQAIVLRASPEGILPLEARFWSSTGPPALRPQMRLTYVPKITLGVP